MQPRNGPLLAWFGDPDLKAQVVARMKEHRAQDEIVQGTYQERSETAGGFKGCAVGCTLPNLHAYVTVIDDGVSYLVKEFKDPADQVTWRDGGGYHGLVEKYYGISGGVAHNIDDVFEDQESHQAAGDFAVSVLETIPVGADLTGIAERYVSWYDEEDYRLQERYGCDWPIRARTDLVRRSTAYLLHLLATAPVPEPV